jgi:hypothetical protein
MQACPVSPRDTRWEWDDPRYRVYFWVPGRSSEWELTGADVDEVLRWAAEHAEGRNYVVYARIEDTEGPGLIRLLGTDHP